MRALLVGLAVMGLWACADWDALETAALCAKAGRCDGGTAGGTAGGSTGGGDSGGTGGATGGGTAGGATGGGTAGGGTAGGATGGGATGGGTAGGATGGGATGGGASGGGSAGGSPGGGASTGDGGCRDSDAGVRWCSLPNGLVWDGGRPSIQMVDCGGKVCFCSQSASNQFEYGVVDPVNGLQWHQPGGQAATCAAMAMVGGKPVLVTDLGIGLNTFTMPLTSGGLVAGPAVPAFSVAGAAAFGAADGGRYAIVGSSATTPDSLVWATMPAAGITTAHQSGIPLEVFAPVSLRDGGAVAMPFRCASCSSPVQVVLLQASDIYSQPWSVTNLATASTSGPVLAATSSQSLWLAFQTVSSNVSVSTYDLAGPGSFVSDNHSTINNTPLVGLAVKDDQHGYVVFEDLGGQWQLQTFAVSGGSLNAVGKQGLGSRTAVTVQQVALVGTTLALSASCPATSAVCPTAGVGMIGFVPAP